MEALEKGIVKLEKEKVRSMKLYLVGYSSCLKKYVLSVGVVSRMVIFHRHFEISWDEYELFEKDIEALDSLAKECSIQGNNSERFLFSDVMAENTLEQHRVREQVVIGMYV